MPAPMPSTPTPRVTVIMPCRNEAGEIEVCLESILAQHPPPGGFEVVVADGRSDDGTDELLARFAAHDSRVRIVDNPSRHTPAGLNAGIRAARGDVIVRMDAHTRYAPDYLVQCVATLAATGADNVGGPWVARGSRYRSRAIAAAFQSPFAVGGARGHNPAYEGPVDTVYLGCWPRTGFERFGFFDETFIRNQDDEHNLRITRGGGTVWQSPRIRSWYVPRASLGSLARQYHQYGYWKVRVIRKHRLPASIRHVVPGLFVFTLLVCALAAPWVWPLRAFGAVALGAYALTVGAATLATAARTEWRLAPILPPVFAAYHFGYGVGFLHALIDGIVLRRRAIRNSTIALTREPPR